MTSLYSTDSTSETQLNIDPEFKALIPPLSTEERELLEASLKAEGCRDVLVIWKGHNILIDGHNRYELCSKSNIPYKTIEREFESREDVIVWIARNQMARRNISDFTRGRLALKAEEAIRTKAKVNQLATLKQGDKSPVLANLPKREAVDTRKELSVLSGVGERSIDKVRTIEASAPRAIVDKADKGELSIDRAFKITGALKNASPAIVETVVKNNVEDVDTINELKRVEKDAPDTFEEIVRSGHIQPSDPAKTVHIADGFKAVQNALRDKSKDHAVINLEARKAQRIENALKPDAKYRIIYADPPWKYGNTMPDYFTEQADHYDLMTVKEIAALPIKDIAEKDAVLFMWVTSPILEESFEVINAWGFKYKASFIWDKMAHVMGHYNSVRHELLLICVRGSCTPDIPKLIPSVVSIPRSDKHSEKPERFREIIDELYPNGKRVELFARTTAKGWEGYGNDLPEAA